jgi:hypothetical protein
VTRLELTKMRFEHRNAQARPSPPPQTPETPGGGAPPPPAGALLTVSVGSVAVSEGSHSNAILTLEGSLSPGDKPACAIMHLIRTPAQAELRLDVNEYRLQVSAHDKESLREQEVSLTLTQIGWRNLFGSRRSPYSSWKAAGGASAPPDSPTPGASGT